MSVSNITVENKLFRLNFDISCLISRIFSLAVSGRCDRKSMIFLQIVTLYCDEIYIRTPHKLCRCPTITWSGRDCQIATRRTALEAVAATHLIYNIITMLISCVWLILWRNYARWKRREVLNLSFNQKKINDCIRENGWWRWSAVHTKLISLQRLSVMAPYKPCQSTSKANEKAFGFTWKERRTQWRKSRTFVPK